MRLLVVRYEITRSLQALAAQFGRVSCRTLLQYRSRHCRLRFANEICRVAYGEFGSGGIRRAALGVACLHMSKSVIRRRVVAGG